MTIVEFLLARIAEDEAVAREAIADDEKVARAPGTMPRPGLRTSELEVCVDYTWGATGLVEIHPARVLAECQAKRAIIEATAHWWNPHPGQPHTNAGYERDDSCDLCWNSAATGQRINPATLRHLAAVYADHPAYDPAWQPA